MSKKKIESSYRSEEADFSYSHAEKGIVFDFSARHDFFPLSRRWIIRVNQHNNNLNFAILLRY